MNTGTGHRDRGGILPPQFDLAELSKRLNCLARIGIVVEADYEAGKVRCRIDGPTDEEEIRTDWLPWTVPSACNDRDWSAPEVNEQVCIFAPCGEMAQAFVMGALNRKDYPHEANHPDYRKTVFTHKEDKTEKLDAILEFNRNTGIRRWWIKEDGGFRWEIGTKACLIMDGDHIQLRVGTTQIVIKDGSIKCHVKGRTSELLLDERMILAQVQDKSVFKMTQTEVSSSVGGKGILKVMASLVEASVLKNAVLSIRSDSISAKLELQQVRLGLFATQVKLWVKNNWLRLTTGKAELRVPGSVIAAESTRIFMQAPQFDTSVGSAPPGVYEAGALAETFTKPANSEPHETIKAPEWSKGKAPFRPVSSDTSGPVS